MPNISIWEILLLLLVLLLVFGPKRLPQMGRSLGHGMREFKDSITGKSKPEEGTRRKRSPRSRSSRRSSPQRLQPSTDPPPPPLR